MDCIMHFVLHSSEKRFRHFVTWIIVRRCGINVRNLLVEVALVTTNISDTLQ